MEASFHHPLLSQARALECSGTLRLEPPGTIDDLEKVELEDPRYRTVDGFHVPLLVGMCLLLVTLLLEFLWIREAP